MSNTVASSVPVIRMTAAERRATVSLASIYGLRLLGMFIILPVFALYAETLPGGASHTLIGVALGAYGLTQAILQIPFGWASDRWGRKPVIYAGLAVFALGSFVAAAAGTIGWVIVGRCLQGAGAISAAVIALTADLTRDTVRTRAMAVIGITIALTFAASLIAGPVLKAWMGVPGIFALTGVLALAAVAVVRYAVPDPDHASDERSVSRGQFAQVLVDTQLVRLNFGTFALHAVLMAMFTQIPFALRDNGLAAERHWVVYFPVLIVSILLMLPFIRQVDRPGRAKPLFNAAVVVLLGAQVALAFTQHALLPLCIAMTLLLRGAEPARGDAAVAHHQVRVARCPRRRDRRQLQHAVPGRLRRRHRGRMVRASTWAKRRSSCSASPSPFLWLIGSATMAAPPARFGSNYSMGET